MQYLVMRSFVHPQYISCTVCPKQNYRQIVNSKIEKRPNKVPYCQCYFKNHLVSELVMTFNTKTSDYQCKQCNKYYTSKQGLANHMRYICGKAPKLRCPFCPRTCKLKHQLENHVYNKHMPRDFVGSREFSAGMLPQNMPGLPPLSVFSPMAKFPPPMTQNTFDS